MRQLDANLITPIYVKTADDPSWPEDAVFYLLSADGLFLCRNHRFFRSSVRVESGPRELEGHAPSFHLRYPSIPGRLAERAVGFFSMIGERHGAEAAVMLARDERTGEVHPLVPPQRSSVYTGQYGGRWPIGVAYRTADPLPEGWGLFGSMHSHVYGSAYASATDERDESYRTGLHIVVGRIDREPPEFHVEAVVDGVRFPVEPGRVLGEYARRRFDVPPEWYDQVEIEVETPYGLTIESPIIT